MNINYIHLWIFTIPWRRMCSPLKTNVLTFEEKCPHGWGHCPHVWEDKCPQTNFARRGYGIQKDLNFFSIMFEGHFFCSRRNWFRSLKTTLGTTTFFVHGWLLFFISWAEINSQPGSLFPFSAKQKKTELVVFITTR